MLIRLRVAGPGGQVTEMQLDAANEADAVRIVVGRGARVVGFVRDEASAKSGETRGVFPLLLFSQELLALLEAGLTLGEAIATLCAKERNPAARVTLDAIQTALREGKNFSDALAIFPAIFPDVYVATVRAAERTGDLPMALSRYVAYQIQFETIRRKLVSASIYPAMLLTVGGFVTLFLLGYVVPKFSMAYESAGKGMPAASLWLLAIGRFIHAYWTALLTVMAVAVAVAVRFASDPANRKAMVDLVTRLPGLAERSDAFRLARFYRALSLLLSAGISLPKALPMLSGLLGMRQRVALATVQRDLEEGKPFSATLVIRGLADPVTESLIKVGERSGNLAEMMDRAARFHDDDFARWLDWSMRLLEPLLMTVLGVVIGGIVVLMYMPVFELAGSLQ